MKIYLVYEGDDGKFRTRSMADKDIYSDSDFAEQEAEGSATEAIALYKAEVKKRRIAAAVSVVDRATAALADLSVDEAPIGDSA